MASDAKQVSEITETDTPALSVVAPAYNEAESLTPLVAELTTVCDDLDAYQPYEIVIVNDGSTDGTAATLDDLAATHAPVRAVHLTRNHGQSAALAAGLDHARGERVVTLDADLQNDPADIPRLLRELERGYDCVSGNRADREDPLRKTVPSRIQTQLAKRTGPDIEDFGCTLKAYRADTLADVDLRGEGHRYLPSKLYAQGYRIAELDVSHREREYGETKYGAGRLLRGFVDLLFHWAWNRFGARPMHVFGGLGVLTLGIGVAIGGFSLIQRLVFGVPLAPHLPRLILVAVLVIAGLQFLVFGFLAETVVTLRFKDEQPYRVERVIE